MQWFIYTCEMYTHLFIYMKWNYFLPFFPMQYLNKNLWDTLGDVFFSFYKQHQICTMLERKKKRERETISNSQIMKFRKENSNNNYKVSGYCYSINRRCLIRKISKQQHLPCKFSNSQIFNILLHCSISVYTLIRLIVLK